MSRLREQVKAFHDACGIETPSTPRVPDVDVVRLRLRLITEEYFELLEAAGVLSVEGANEQISESINAVSGNVNLPDLIDALGDIDYVVEGTRLCFGVDGGPIADAIQAANARKIGPGGKVLRNAAGKVTKPEGWTPPDIADELRKQGWKE